MSKQPEQRIAFTHSADNTQIAYALSGEGKPLVRAGTWLTHIQYDWESAIWSHWFHLMSERHTLVRYDPRGCGLSERKVTDISLDKWVDDLAADTPIFLVLLNASLMPKWSSLAWITCSEIKRLWLPCCNLVARNLSIRSYSAELNNWQASHP